MNGKGRREKRGGIDYRTTTIKPKEEEDQF
jgi:hypothetical protein